MPILIGLDIGQKRSGIARADALGIVIKPLKTCLTSELINELKSLDESYGIGTIVVGTPCNEGLSTETIDFVKTKTEELKSVFTQTEFHFVDERFTSKEAESILKNKGVKLNKDNKELIDMYAAAIILEVFVGGDLG
jgi:putative Holliday junction resolvase